MDNRLIIKCPNCGQRNRLSRRGIFRCGSCKGTVSIAGKEAFLPGTTDQLEALARTMAAGVLVLSGKVRETVSTKLKLATPESIDLFLLGFHLLDRTIFQIFGDDGRKIFTDESLREAYRIFTSEATDSDAEAVGRSLIERVNATQKEFSNYRKLFPENFGEDAARLLYGSGNENSGYLIVEFVKKHFSPQELRLADLSERRPLLLLTEAIGYYATVQKLLSSVLNDES